MGVRTADLAETVRAAYYMKRSAARKGRHEVKVMVTYPREDRKQLSNFDWYPCDLMMELNGLSRNSLRSTPKLFRNQPNRSSEVHHDLHDLDVKVANAAEVVEDPQAGFIPDLLKEFPSIE